MPARSAATDPPSPCGRGLGGWGCGSMGTAPSPQPPPARGGGGISGLPAEAVYLPFEAGPYRMAMALTTVPDSAWFQIDVRYADEMTERRRLLAERHHDVFGALPGSDAARAETLREIVANLTTHFPHWFTRHGDTLHNALTGETWNLVAPPCDPLELAGRLVQEDLCIIHNTDSKNDGVGRLRRSRRGKAMNSLSIADAAGCPQSP